MQYSGLENIFRKISLKGHVLVTPRKQERVGATKTLFKLSELTLGISIRNPLFNVAYGGHKPATNYRVDIVNYNCTVVR